MSAQSQIAKVGPGEFSATFPFSAAGITKTGNIQMLLTATSDNGTRVSLPVPLSLVNQ